MDINCEDMEDRTCKVTYCPTEPGNYNVNIKFAEKHIPGEIHKNPKNTETNLEMNSCYIYIWLFFFFPGSPFTVKVTGEGRIRESITRKRQASSLASVGSTCGLNLKIPGE